jgi:hypothetical protein
MRFWKPLKRILQGVCLLLVALVAVAGVLPVVLSGGKVQAWLQARVNQELGETQQVSWGRFSLGWFGEQRIEDVVFRDQGLALTIDRITIDRGLLAIVGRDLRLGQITIEQPRIAVVLPALEEDGQPEPESAVWPAVTVNDAEAKPGNRSADVSVDAAARDASVAEQVPFRLPVDIRGAVVVRNGSVQVTNATATDQMRWEDMLLKADFRQGLRQALDLQFAAKLDHASGKGDVAVALTARIFQSDGSFDSGSFATDLFVDMRNINLASMAWIPHEQAGVPMLHGILDTKLEFRVAGMEQAQVALLVALRDPAVFGGWLGSDRLAPGDITIHAQGKWQERVLRLDAIRLDNPLVQLSAAGTLDASRDAAYPVGRVSMESSVNLAGILEQLHQTLSLHEGLVLEEGRVLAKASLDSDGARAALRGSVEIPHVRALNDQQVLAFENLLKAQVGLAMSPDGPEIEELVLQTAFAHVQGKGNLDALEFSGKVDLGAARQMAAHFVDLGSQVLSGSVSIEGALQKSSAEAGAFRVAATSEGLRLGPAATQVFVLDALRVETQGDLHFHAETGAPVRASGIRALLQSDPVKLSVNVPEIDLTSKPPALPAAGAQWDIDLGRVHALLASAAVLTNGVSFSGQLRGALQAAVENEVLVVSPFETHLQQLRFAAPGVDFEDPSITMRWGLSLALPPAATDLVLTNALLEGASFSLQIPRVHVALPDGTLPRLALDARLATDLGALMPLVQNATGAPIAMEGQSITAVSWKGLLDPVWENMVRQGQGMADIRVPRIKAYGLLATNAMIAVKAEAGRIHMTLDTAANDGRVHIEPVVDVTGDQPLLIVPENARVIQNVTLTDEMASELLGLVHPLLRGSAVLGGHLDFTLERCRIPLDETGVQGADLSGVFVLRDFAFEPQGALLQVMETAKLRARTVRVAEQKIAFHVADGRIHPAPLALHVSGHAMSLAGSVGLDTSLDYKILVPVTAELVGREAFRLLEGQTLALAIGGTAMRPEIAREAFAQAIAGLVQEAARSAVREEGREAVREIQQRGEEALRELLRQRR